MVIKCLSYVELFFWENSEDIGGWHGPYGDIKIEAWNPIILSFSESQLNNTWQYIEPSYRINNSVLPGPIWSGYAKMWYPDPYHEWVDGPFGCIYSNIAIYDWEATGAKKSIAVAVAEADKPNSFMGVYNSVITADTPGEILIKVGGFGFVVLENITAPRKEPKVSKGDVYWYGNS